MRNADPVMNTAPTDRLATLRTKTAEGAYTLGRQIRACGRVLPFLLALWMTESSCSGTATQASRPDHAPTQLASVPKSNARARAEATTIHNSSDTHAANSPTPSGKQPTSCDIRPELGGNSSEHICVAWSATNADTKDVTNIGNDCAALGGIAGNGCDTSGTVAGCRGVTDGEGKHVITFTYWYYAGSLSSVTSTCLSPMMVVLPVTMATPDHG
jgi:hypothetical protein